MVESTNLSYQEIKEVLSIFFDLPQDSFKCWNSQWSFSCPAAYIQKKIDENRQKLKAGGA